MSEIKYGEIMRSTAPNGIDVCEQYMLQRPAHGEYNGPELYVHRWSSGGIAIVVKAYGSRESSGHRIDLSQEEANMVSRVIRHPMSANDPIGWTTEQIGQLICERDRAVSDLETLKRIMNRK